MSKKLIRLFALVLSFLLIFEQSGFAQIAGELNIAGHLASLRSSLTQDKFRPLHLRYLSYDKLNNNFKILLDKGGLANSRTGELENSTKTLLHYFFIGISLPNESFWVNLRPDSPENIIDPFVEKTDVGKIFLEADLQLKKDTALATSPQTPEGREYWDRLYKKAGELFGDSSVTIPTLTRPWIVPDEIIIRESQDNAYVYKATLKVMLEQDYLKNSQTYSFNDERLKQLNEYASQLIRETIIPKLTKDVNTAKRYAPLRQVYYSLILAQWFKKKFYGEGGLYSYLIDKRNLNGLTSKEPWSKDTYFQAYRTSFAQGEYNIKEPIQTLAGQSIRTYMSGGIMMDASSPIRSGALKGRMDGAPLKTILSDGLIEVAGSPLANEAPLVKVSIPENLLTATSGLKQEPVMAQEQTESIAEPDLKPSSWFKKTAILFTALGIFFASAIEARGTNILTANLGRTRDVISDIETKATSTMRMGFRKAASICAAQGVDITENDLMALAVTESDLKDKVSPAGAKTFMQLTEKGVNYLNKAILDLSEKKKNGKLFSARERKDYQLIEAFGFAGKPIPFDELVRKGNEYDIISVGSLMYALEVSCFDNFNLIKKGTKYQFIKKGHPALHAKGVSIVPLSAHISGVCGYNTGRDDVMYLYRKLGPFWFVEFWDSKTGRAKEGLPESLREPVRQAVIFSRNSDVLSRYNPKGGARRTIDLTMFKAEDKPVVMAKNNVLKKGRQLTDVQKRLEAFRRSLRAADTKAKAALENAQQRVSKKSVPGAASPRSRSQLSANRAGSPLAQKESLPGEISRRSFLRLAASFMGTAVATLAFPEIVTSAIKAIGKPGATSKPSLLGRQQKRGLSPEIIASKIEDLLKQIPKEYAFVPDYKGEVKALLLQYRQSYHETILSLLNVLPSDIDVTIVYDSGIEEDMMFRSLLELGKKNRNLRALPIKIPQEKNYPGHLSVWARDSFLPVPDSAGKSSIAVMPYKSVNVYEANEMSDGYVVPTISGNGIQPLEAPFYFQGGNVLVDREGGKTIFFMGSNSLEWNKTLLEGAEEKPVALRDNAELVFLPSFDEIAHLDTILTFLRDKDNNKIALVASFEEALKVIRNNPEEMRNVAVRLGMKSNATPKAMSDFMRPYQKKLNVIAAIMKRRDYKVILLPWIGAAREQMTLISYNNSLLLGKDRVIMGEYGLATDQIAKKIFTSFGYDVTTIDARQLISGFGSIRCITNVLLKKSNTADLRSAIAGPIAAGSPLAQEGVSSPLIEESASSAIEGSAASAREEKGNITRRRFLEHLASIATGVTALVVFKPKSSEGFYTATKLIIKMDEKLIKNLFNIINNPVSSSKDLLDSFRVLQDGLLSGEIKTKRMILEQMPLVRLKEIIESRAQSSVKEAAISMLLQTITSAINASVETENDAQKAFFLKKAKQAWQALFGVLPTIEYIIKNDQDIRLKAAAIKAVNQLAKTKDSVVRREVLKVIKSSVSVLKNIVFNIIPSGKLEYDSVIGSSIGALVYALEDGDSNSEAALRTILMTKEYEKKKFCYTIQDYYISVRDAAIGAILERFQYGNYAGGFKLVADSIEINPQAAERLIESLNYLHDHDKESFAQRTINDKSVLSDKNLYLLLAEGRGFYTSTFALLYNALNVRTREGTALDNYIASADPASKHLPNFILIMGNYKKLYWLFKYAPSLLPTLERLLLIAENAIFLSEGIYPIFKDNDTNLQNAIKSRLSASHQKAQGNAKRVLGALIDLIDKRQKAADSILDIPYKSLINRDNTITLAVAFEESAQLYQAELEQLFAGERESFKKINGYHRNLLLGLRLFGKNAKKDFVIEKKINNLTLRVIAADTNTIAQLIAENKITINILSTRSHSYEFLNALRNTLGQRPEKDVLVVPGACGSYRDIVGLFNTYPNAKFITNAGIDQGDKVNLLLYFILETFGERTKTWEDARGKMSLRIKSIVEERVWPDSISAILRAHSSSSPVEQSVISSPLAQDEQGASSTLDDEIAGKKDQLMKSLALLLKHKDDRNMPLGLKDSLLGLEYQARNARVRKDPVTGGYLPGASPEFVLTQLKSMEDLIRKEGGLFVQELEKKQAAEARAKDEAKIRELEEKRDKIMSSVRGDLWDPFNPWGEFSYEKDRSIIMTPEEYDRIEEAIETAEPYVQELEEFGIKSTVFQIDKANLAKRRNEIADFDKQFIWTERDEEIIQRKLAALEKEGEFKRLNSGRPGKFSLHVGSKLILKIGNEYLLIRHSGSTVGLALYQCDVIGSATQDGVPSLRERTKVRLPQLKLLPLGNRSIFVSGNDVTITDNESSHGTEYLFIGRDDIAAETPHRVHWRDYQKGLKLIKSLSYFFKYEGSNSKNEAEIIIEKVRTWRPQDKILEGHIKVVLGLQEGDFENSTNWLRKFFRIYHLVFLVVPNPETKKTNVLLGRLDGYIPINWKGVSRVAIVGSADLATTGKGGFIIHHYLDEAYVIEDRTTSDVSVRAVATHEANHLFDIITAIERGIRFSGDELEYTAYLAMLTDEEIAQQAKKWLLGDQLETVPHFSILNEEHSKALWEIARELTARTVDGYTGREGRVAAEDIRAMDWSSPHGNHWGYRNVMLHFSHSKLVEKAIEMINEFYRGKLGPGFNFMDDYPQIAKRPIVDIFPQIKNPSDVSADSVPKQNPPSSAIDEPSVGSPLAQEGKASSAMESYAPGPPELVAQRMQVLNDHPEFLLRNFVFKNVEEIPLTIGGLDYKMVSEKIERKRGKQYRGMRLTPEDLKKITSEGLKEEDTKFPIYYFSPELNDAIDFAFYPQTYDYVTPSPTNNFMAVIVTYTYWQHRADPNSEEYLEEIYVFNKQTKKFELLETLSVSSPLEDNPIAGSPLAQEEAILQATEKAASSAVTRVGKKAKEDLIENAKKDSRLVPALNLEETIGSLEGEIAGFGIDWLPDKIGFRSSRIGMSKNVPFDKKAWWYFYYDREDSDDNGNNNVAMSPEEFFERLQGTVVMAMDYSTEGGRSPNKIAIVWENPKLKDFKMQPYKASYKRGSLIKMNGPGEEKSQVRFFYNEGKEFNYWDEIGGTVFSEVGISPKELKNIDAWVTTYAAINEAKLSQPYEYDGGVENDPKISLAYNIKDLKQYFKHRLLYKKTLEEIIKLAQGFIDFSVAGSPLAQEGKAASLVAQRRMRVVRKYFDQETGYAKSSVGATTLDVRADPMLTKFGRFEATPLTIIEGTCKALELKDKIVFSLGSGQGPELFVTVAYGAARAVGIEGDSDLVSDTRTIVRHISRNQEWEALAGKIEAHDLSFTSDNVSLRKADIIFFTEQSFRSQGIEDKFMNELKPDARVVVFGKAETRVVPLFDKLERVEISNLPKGVEVYRKPASSTIEQPELSSPLVQSESASSAIKQESVSLPLIPSEEGKGGIDLRNLPIVTQEMGNSNVLRDSPHKFPEANRQKFRGQSLDLAAELTQIQNMLSAGIVPSTERIKEYLQACCSESDFNREIEKVLACVADILRLEEDSATATEPALKEMLVLIESDKNPAAFQDALAAVVVSAGEPKHFE